MKEGRQTELSRERTRFVFKKAKSWPASSLKDITTQAQGLPVTLRSQGLVVTLARLEAGEKKANNFLTGMLLDWLTEGAGYMRLKKNAATVRELVDLLQEVDRPTYIAVQREALALAENIKLISKAFFSGKEG